MALSTSPVTIQEVETLLNKLKMKKSPGEDCLDNKTLKSLPTKAVLYTVLLFTLERTVYIVLLFNSVLRLIIFPSAWKSAIIIMIPKPVNQPTEVDVYRPISLLPALGKIMERVILDRILKIESVKRALAKCQFGFRQSHGTP
ncbi:hypothetical protein KR018_000783, partial [Drosophila ironensis]